MDLSTFLSGLKAAGALIENVREVREVFEAASDLVKGGDKPIAKEALADIAARNDARFSRLDAKLEAAKNR